MREIALKVVAAVFLAVLVYSIPSLLIAHETPQIKAAHTQPPRTTTPTVTTAKPKVAVEEVTETVTKTLSTVTEGSETGIGVGGEGGGTETYHVEGAEARAWGLLFSLPVAFVLAFATAFTASRIRQR